MKEILLKHKFSKKEIEEVLIEREKVKILNIENDEITYIDTKKDVKTFSRICFISRYQKYVEE